MMGFAALYPSRACSLRTCLRRDVGDEPEHTERCRDRADRRPSTKTPCRRCRCRADRTADEEQRHEQAVDPAARLGLQQIDGAAAERLIGGDAEIEQHGADTKQGEGLSLIHISEPTRLLSISYA